ncbi:MAG: sensor histidine kinase, partial [Stenotrophomonas sp.]
VKAIQARRTAADALWLQEGENAVTVSLRGDPEPRTLANEAMRTLCARLNADVGALYRLHGERLVLVGGAALPSNLPESLPTAAGQWGEVVRLGEPRRLEEGDSVLQIETTLGRTPVHQRLLGPVTADGVVVGLVELGRSGASPARALELELLTQCAEPLGVAMRTALLRAQLVELLEETQRQSEELQTQQEELRVANEELEEQSRSLLHSQANLEQQQAELEQTNVQLEERTHELESRQQALLLAQGQLVQNSKELEASSRYKSEFLANMSHELRTPLNSSLILAKLLADNKDATLTAEQVKYAQAIHSSNNDLLALINDILDLSRIEAGHVELAEENLAVSSVLQRLKDTFEPLAAQKGLALRIQAEADAPTQLVADSQRLQQILKNLLANAVKFTEHGSVALVVSGSGAGRIRFAVTDTGIGIAQAQTEVIFE